MDASVRPVPASQPQPRSRSHSPQKRHPRGQPPSSPNSPAAAHHPAPHQTLHLQHPPPALATAQPPLKHDLAAAESRVSSRLLPWLVGLVLVSFIDRSNLAFASLSLNADLGLSGTLYGLGSGLFFLGYAACQVPSNLLLLRWGGPTWLAALAAAWGAAAAAGAAIQGPATFLLLRLLLGTAESGAMPGIWYYVSCFYAPERTTVPLAVIETGITASQILAAPLAAGLLSLHGLGGLAGWRWLFLLEGLPALALAVGIRLCLPRSVEAASFLTPRHKAALMAALHPGHDSSSSTSPGREQLEPAACPAAPAAHLAVLPAQHSARGHQPIPELSPDGAVPSPPPVTGWHRLSDPSGDGHLEDESAALMAGASISSSSSGQHAANSRLQPAGAGSALGAGQTWQQLRRVLVHPVVLYAGSWRVLHDVPGYAILYWTPLLVAALVEGPAGGQGVGGQLQQRPHSSSWGQWGQHAANTSMGGVALPTAGRLQQGLLGPHPAAAAAAAAAAGPPASAGVHGRSAVALVLLSAIPYAAASCCHLLNAWHSRRSGEWRWHIAGCWWLGSAALLLLPLAGGLHPAVAFLVLVLAHVGLNGANGLQTGLVARCFTVGDKALGLAAYNSLGSLGGLVGPLLVGVLVDATGGYGQASVVMGVCLAAAAAMVWCFRPSYPHENTSHPL